MINYLVTTQQPYSGGATASGDDDISYHHHLLYDDLSDTQMTRTPDASEGRVITDTPFVLQQTVDYNIVQGLCMPVRLSLRRLSAVDDA